MFCKSEIHVEFVLDTIEHHKNPEVLDLPHDLQKL